MQPQTDWITGLEAWAEFVALHPELGYRDDRWAFYNFLRHFRQSLVNHDAIRCARHRLWIAHRGRFCKFAFECATGRAALLPIPADVDIYMEELADGDLRQIYERHGQRVVAGSAA